MYPALIKGPAVGFVDGRLMVAGGMAYPWREVEYGFWLATEDTPEEAPSVIVPGEQIESPLGSWHPMPPIPVGPGWTSGATTWKKLADRPTETTSTPPSAPIGPLTNTLREIPTYTV